MVSLIQKTEEILKKIEKEDKLLNSFIHINKNAVEDAEVIEKKIKVKKAGKLAGKIIAVKSNINVLGMVASCGSKVLENYISAYDATVIKKIKEEDGLIIGMTNMDEFACGSSGETSYFGATKNPINHELIPGGSSSGSAVAVAAGFCDLALGSDTGGSIRNPASHCGVIGIKPSYGLVSRYGLIDLSMSLDQIGIFGTNIKDISLLLNIIKGKDEKDPSSLKSEKIDIKPIKKIVVGTSSSFDSLCKDKRILDLISKKINQFLEITDSKEKNVKLNHIDLSIQAYYPIVYTEFFSGTRRFSGRLYGSKIEEFCGPEVLRRIMGGSEISKAEYHGQFYKKAIAVKQIIKKEFENAFKEVDCIICPTIPKLPHKIGSQITPQEMYAYDALTIPANLAEICAISIPAGKIEGIPIGIQILCPAMKESRLLSIASSIEKL